MMKHIKNTRGFSLVELAVVISVVSVMVATGVNMGSDAVDYSKRFATEQQLKQIQASMDAYFLRNLKLPCPADRSLRPGVDANFGTGSCTVNGTHRNVTSGANGPAWYGMVPTRSLSLPDTYAADGWGNKIYYAVSSAVTAVNFLEDSENLDIRGGDPAGSNYPLTGTASAAFVVLSHGEDGVGAYNYRGSIMAKACSGSTIGVQNCNNDANNVFYDTFFNDGDTNLHFDDHVVWGTAGAIRGAVPCTQGVVSWGAGCSANTGTDGVSGAAPIAITNTAGGYTGSATVACQADGTWATPVGTCSVAAPCSTSSLSWGGGCSASFAGISSGATSPSTNNTAGGYTGSATATCTNGVWSTPSGSCSVACTPSPSGCQYLGNGGGCLLPTESQGAAQARLLVSTGTTSAYCASRCASWSGPRHQSSSTWGTTYTYTSTCTTSPNNWYRSVGCRCCYTAITCPSDIRLKTDIVQVASLPEFNLYEYSYKGDASHTRYRGVMAQEVMHIPGAVVTMPNGYYAVNYGVLSVPFERID